MIISRNNVLNFVQQTELTHGLHHNCIIKSEIFDQKKKSPNQTVVKLPVPMLYVIVYAVRHLITKRKTATRFIKLHPIKNAQIKNNKKANNKKKLYDYSY